jgi:hypothetical protein
VRQGAITLETINALDPDVVGMEKAADA